MLLAKSCNRLQLRLAIADKCRAGTKQGAKQIKINNTRNVTMKIPCAMSTLIRHGKC